MLQNKLRWTVLQAQSRLVIKLQSMAIKGTIKAGNVTIDGENGTIKAGDKVTIDGKDGKIAAGKVSVDGKDGYVTGLENKDWDPNNITSGRAATEDQLQNLTNL